MTENEKCAAYLLTVYDEFYDYIICPEYQILKYSTTNRDSYREYKSNPNVCAECLTRELFTRSKDCVKTVKRHIWKDYEDLADDARYMPCSGPAEIAHRVVHSWR